jgi:uncharacterized secreted protein with C-terminal beta-propeller domain
MRTRHTVWVLTVLAVALMPGLLEARERGPRRFSNYKQIARALKQPQFAAAYGALDRRVGLALGQPEVAMADVLPAAAAAADAVAGEATGTNTQVAGVDEADLVKSDGTYLYLVTNGRLAVVRAARALPGGETAPLELVSLVDLGDDSFVPSELHLYGSLVVVVGMSYDYSFLTDPPVEAARVASLMPIWAGTARTVLRIYDVSVPEEPSLVRELEVEGTHLASRRIGQYLYVLARAYPWLDAALETRRRAAAPGLVPKVGDSLDEGSRDLRPGEVSCLPGCYEASYLVVAAVDLASAEGEFVPHAFLGGGNIVYASATNLYVAASSWFWRPMLVLADDGTVAETPEQETVTLFRFELDGTNVRFAARGSAPGRVLNQFGMDEHEGVFRIATTFYPNVWTDAAETSGVYTYDLGFGRLGAIEGLAPGERIYAARFLGDRCYLVTFETIDPLFVIDLADPAAPAVLGELEVPGYSAYLHPVGPNHLIGLGKDVQMVQTPWSGEEGVPMEQGLKLALFDVTDVTQPVEVDAELIGVRGSHSEALYDHHAFLYDAERQLVAFPCTIREFIDPPDPEEFWWWGDFVFQGVVAYGLDLATGFERRGAVTHMEEGTVEVWDAPWERTVRRALVAGELLHTVSEGMVKANDTATMAERSALRLPWDEVPVDDPLVYWLDPGTAGEVSGDPILDWSEAAPPADGLLGPTRIPNAAAAVGELLRGYLEARR